jgi:large conductance mechanosensitive channel
MWNDFKAFLLKQNVIALAIAVVIGAALGKVVTGVVEDFIMPIVGAITPGGDWQKATWDVGSIKFGVGNFVSVLIDFLIVSFVVWRIAKVFIKPAAAAEKPATKDCQFCKMSIDAAATRCAFCTSAL